MEIGRESRILPARRREDRLGSSSHSAFVVKLGSLLKGLRPSKGRRGFLKDIGARGDLSFFWPFLLRIWFQIPRWKVTFLSSVSHSPARLSLFLTSVLASLYLGRSARQC